MSVGLYYGVEKVYKSKYYSYNSHYFKFQFCNTIKESRKFRYQLLVQPQVDFVEDQILNLYYSSPDVPNYCEKRDEYVKLKSITNYSLNCGLLMS
jgi:hypothetical protein